MPEFSTVAVGSMPLACAAALQRDDWPHTTTPCRLQATDVDSGLTMFRELQSLASGRRTPSLEPDPLAVRKAQLPGPATLLASEEATLKGTFRHLRAALDTLYHTHPALEEVWMDEPLLGQRPELIPLVGKCIAALRGEYHGLRFGVHTCASARFDELFAQGIDCLHVDAQLDGPRAIDAWRGVTAPAAAPDSWQRPELVLGVVTTTTATPLPRLVDQTRALVDRMRPDELGVTTLRLSTTCGLGTLSAADARDRMQTLADLAAALNG